MKIESKIYSGKTIGKTPDYELIRNAIDEALTSLADQQQQGLAGNRAFEKMLSDKGIEIGARRELP